MCGWPHDLSGLLITYVALNLMDGHGQPALLYIVPFTLGNEDVLNINMQIMNAQAEGPLHCIA